MVFGKKTAEIKKENQKLKAENVAATKALEEAKPDLVVEKPQTETVGMPGFTQPVEEPKPAEAQAPAPVAAQPTPEPEKPAEQYSIVEVGVGPAEGLYVYKIVTNKYLGELGGVYEA